MRIVGIAPRDRVVVTGSMSDGSDRRETILHEWVASIELDDGRLVDQVYEREPTPEEAMASVSASSPPPTIAWGTLLPRYIYTTKDGQIVGAGLSEDIPQQFQSAGASEANYLGSLPTSDMRWHAQSRKFVLRISPRSDLERLLVWPLVDQTSRLETLKQVGLASGLPSTPMIDARLDEIRTSLGLIAGVYEGLPPDPDPPIPPAPPTSPELEPDPSQPQAPEPAPTPPEQKFAPSPIPDVTSRRVVRKRE